jgi:signal peptidase I
VKLAAGSFPALIKDILQQDHSLRCRTLGSCMLPLIRSGNIIQVEPVKVQDLRVGDVVVHHDSADALVAHRLIRKSLVQGRIVLITRGDAFPGSAAEEVEPEQVLGRVVEVEWGKGLKIRLSSTPGRLLGILFARIFPPGLWVSGLIQVKHGLTSKLNPKSWRNGSIPE